MNSVNTIGPLSDEVMIRSDKDNKQLRIWVIRMFKRWPTFLITLIIFLLLTYLYLLFTLPVHKAVAAIMVKDEKKGGELMDNSSLKEIGLGGNNKLLENEIEVLRSYDLMEAAVRLHSLTAQVKLDKKLRDIPLFGSQIPFELEILNPDAIVDKHVYSLSHTDQGIKLSSDEDTNDVMIPFNQSVQYDKINFHLIKKAAHDSLNEDSRATNYTLTVSPLHDATMNFLERLSVEPVSKVATVINLEITDESKEKGVVILNSLLDIYNDLGLKDKNKSTNNTIKFLDERLNEVASSLKNIEGGLQKFKSKNRITELSSNSQQYLAIAQEVDNQKTQSQTQLKIVEALEKLLTVDDNNTRLVPSTLGIQEESLATLIERHNELVLQKERVSASSGPLNPLLIDIDNQITEVRKTLLTNVQNLKKAFAISLSQATAKDDELNELIKKVPSYEKDMVNITRDQSVQKDLYAFLLQKREEAAITGASNIEDARTITKPRFSETVSPKKGISWAIGFLCGLLAPVAVFSISGFFANKVTDSDQIKQLSNIPLVGTISHVKKTHPVVVSPTARSLASEQFRNIRTALSYTQKGKQVKTILITSFQPNDGKSFVSLNLAMSYALLNKRTLVLEFDLRKPKISRHLGISPTEGISSILSGKTTIKKVLKPLSDLSENLFLLPAGYLPPNPAELILSDNMRDMMEELKKEFDYLIIDSPPFGLVTDANLIEEYNDLTLVILRQKVTHLDVFDHLKTKVEHFDRNPIYLILNDVGHRRGYGESYTEYGYAKGYYSDL